MRLFKVLIIDDEPNIRKGLINIINWKKFQCEICGEACDGVEGLEKMKSIEPDIVFVDVNMPEVDGLTFIKEGKKINSKCKFVIISGHREFSYMQEAIKIGAFDYILKPTNIEEICEVVKRAVIELKYHNENLDEIDKLKRRFEESIPILKEKLLYDTIFQINVNEDDIEEALALYDLSIKAFVMMVIEINDNSEKKEPYQKQLYQFGVINTVEEMFAEDFKVEKIVLNSKQIAFIILPNNEMDFMVDSIYKKADSILQLVESCFKFTVTISISTKGEGVKDLHVKMLECKDGLSYRFYLGDGSIILYKDLDNFYKGEEDTTFEGYEKELHDAVKTGNKDNVIKILNQIKHAILDTHLEPQRIKTFYWNIINQINSIQVSIKSIDSKSKEEEKDTYNLYRMIDHSNNINELQSLLEEIANNVVNTVNQYNTKNINLTLKNAVDYINENYKWSITLNELAEHTYVSTYYLSRMFKKELGKNFVEYLNEIRVEKAKELLQDPKYKTYEVAELVGIQDSHYFSKLFKKYTNLTPTEYREKYIEK